MPETFAHLNLGKEWYRERKQKSGVGMTSMKNSSPFPSIFEDRKFYVYHHIVDDEIIYTGNGSGARAWMHSFPFRDKEHADYLTTLILEGFLPCDWVVIVDRNMTKKEAQDLERTLLEKRRPRFNKVFGLKLLKVLPDIYDKILILREKGWTYDKIGKTLKLSTMVVHRAVNGKIPALEAMRETR